MSSVTLPCVKRSPHWCRARVRSTRRVASNGVAAESSEQDGCSGFDGNSPHLPHGLQQGFAGKKLAQQAQAGAQTSFRRIA